MISNNITPLDKNKANQPSENPYFHKILSRCSAEDKQEIATLIQKAITYEKAKITFKFSDVYKGRALAKKIGVSHETLYKWMREYAPEILKGGRS